jgi:hypothetical protein
VRLSLNFATIYLAGDMQLNGSLNVMTKYLSVAELIAERLETVIILMIHILMPIDVFKSIFEEPLLALSASFQQHINTICHQLLTRKTQFSFGVIKSFPF